MKTIISPHAADGCAGFSRPLCSLCHLIRRHTGQNPRRELVRTLEGLRGAGVVRSAIVLKALTYAPTTSLPEHVGGERNWDYRFSWIRDSVFTAQTLVHLGCSAEADAFRRFIQRASAGNGEQLQVLYGIDGKRRLTEITLDHLPDVGFVAYDDPRMLRTTQAIRQELDDGGLILRYTAADGLSGGEGSFLACSFWLTPDSCLCGLAAAPATSRSATFRRGCPI